MAAEHSIYGEVENENDLKRIFAEIRCEVEQADSRPTLTELYRRAGYLVTLTHSPAWKKKFGASIATLREIAKNEFRETARKINRRATQIGTEADYDEMWGADR